MIDVRGYSCPTPVILVQNELAKHPHSVEVLSDSPCAVENITRFAQQQGYTVTTKSEQEEEILLLLTK